MKLITHGSWRKYTAYLEGSHREVKAGCRQRERQDLVQVPLLECVGGVLWGFWVKPILIISDQKEQDFGKLPGGAYLKGSQRKALGLRGDC